MAYSVALRIGLLSSCYWHPSGWPIAYPRNPSGNDGWLYYDDIIQIFDYISNPAGIRFSSIEIWFEFKDQATGVVTEWVRGAYSGFRPSWTWCCSAWLGNFCEEGAEAESILGAGKTIEARVCYGPPVNLCSEPAIITIRGPEPECTEGETKCENYNLYECIDGKWAITEHQSPTCGYVKRPSPCPPYGDLDDNGYVTYNDIMLVLKYVSSGWDAVKDGTLLSEEEFRHRADVNADNEIDMADVILIQNYSYYGLDTFLVCTAPLCECTPWVDAECISETQRRQIRTCAPSGCNTEERIIDDPSCDGIPTGVIAATILSGIAAIAYFALKK